MAKSKMTLRVKRQERNPVPEIMANIGDSLRGLCPTLRSRARAICPVDRGILRDSIGTIVLHLDKRHGMRETDPALLLYMGGPGARHANLIEYGSIHNKPFAPLRKTMKEQRSTIRGKIEASVKKPLKAPFTETVQEVSANL